ncbi:MAG: hypothetical protein A2Y84_00310 [Candidatus Colwellbacteria bacterium RBG_13_48_8]|uniref:Carboxypeptidase regulatory-like domain-containing protein n=1 Tax=Candidatus Colwellbacteria bacterium RBG_13_48_8 TaxID=1797685 RepID=A0A1G1YZQ4_9BACT|nr:MAG: hypothetical protein A2Y84_00310 [Candidatus Colwellbacteria bacterium RBG_13_48_8]
MKKLSCGLVGVLALILGYILGSIFPLNIFSSSQTQHPFNLALVGDKGIQGDSQLQVTLKMDNGSPLGNVEVDLAETPGQPPVGGVALSDEDGLAIFNVQPGNYFIFFNDENFPQNIETPAPTPIGVKENEINQIEIILKVR